MTERGKGYSYDREGGGLKNAGRFKAASPADAAAQESFRRDFDSHFEAAVAKLPPKLRDALKEIEVIVDDLPDPALLRRPGMRPFPPTILGFFTGTPLNRRSAFNSMEWPPQIYLFRLNILRDSKDPADMHEQIFITLMHELGHALGLEEGDLRDRGIA